MTQYPDYEIGDVFVVADNTLQSTYYFNNGSIVRLVDDTESYLRFFSSLDGNIKSYLFLCYVKPLNHYFDLDSDDHDDALMLFSMVHPDVPTEKLKIYLEGLKDELL